MKMKSGFTLVELMVTVSIVGVLAAVAVPNYRIQQARSRMSEAKANLATLYAVETSLYFDQGSFSACLADIGYRSIGHYYTVGFTASSATNPLCGPYPLSEQSCANTFDTKGKASPCSNLAGTYSFAPATTPLGGESPSLTSTYILANNFCAQAVGLIGLPDNAPDQLSITDANKLFDVCPPPPTPRPLPTISPSEAFRGTVGCTVETTGCSGNMCVPNGTTWSGHTQSKVCGNCYGGTCQPVVGDISIGTVIPCSNQGYSMTIKSCP